MKGLVEYVTENPGKSATEIAHALGRKAASVSSLLRKLVREGVLLRSPGEGPRGGWGYHPKERLKIRRPTLWWRIRRGVAL